MIAARARTPTTTPTAIPTLLGLPLELDAEEGVSVAADGIVVLVFWVEWLVGVDIDVAEGVAEGV